MIVGVTFAGGCKTYYYNTNMKLLLNGVYDIIVDDHTTYDNFITVRGIKEGHDKRLRTITGAQLMMGPRKPDKPYKDIYVNETKRAICVVWKDGTKTIMKPHPDDDWDVEKGVALCFMKKAFDNRGCYYNAFRDIVYMGE
jgi:hypothetical protein